MPSGGSAQIAEGRSSAAIADDVRRFGSLQGAPLRALDYALFAAVFLVALALRIIYLVMISKSPLFDSPILDAEAHDRWARAIAEGEPFFTGAYFKAPLYPWLLGVIYKLTGGDYMAPRVVQIIMGSLGCGFVFLLGRETFNRAVGAIAGFSASLYWLMIYYDAELLLEPLSIFLALVSLWLIFRAAARKSVGLWALAGLFMGLSAITRPNVLVYMPLIALWILWIDRESFGRAFVRAAVWSVACLIPILPVTIRNYVVGDDFVLIASQGGPNFYIGNNPGSDGYTASLPGSRSTWIDGIADWTSTAEQELGRKLKPSEVDQFFYDKGWAFIRSNPRAAFDLNFAKLQLFFYEWEIPNDSDPTSIAKIHAPFLLSLPIRTGHILAIALVGFFLALLGDGKRLLPLTAFVAIYTATVVAFFVCARFRVPVMPFALVLAAVVPVRLWRAVRAQDWRFVVGVGVFVYLAWIVVNRGVPESVLNKYEAVTYQRNGLKLAEKGLPGGLEAFNRALELDPKCVDALSSLAYYELERGNHEAAIRRFYEVIELSPQMDIYTHFASALAHRGRWEESILILRKGLEHLPGYLDLKRKLAFILATCPIDRLRNGPEAIRLAEDVAGVGEEFPQTYDTLAVAYAEVGRFDDAVRAVTKALEIATRLGMLDAVEQTRARLELFKQKRPFRQSVGLEKSID